MNLSEWVTIVLSVGGAVMVSIAAWYSLKGTVQLNQQRLDQVEIKLDRYNNFAEKLNRIDTRTQLTLQKVEQLESLISGRQVDKRKVPGRHNEFEDEGEP